MAKDLMASPGFESDSTSSDSEPESNQYIVKPSVALTKPGLKTEPSSSSDSDEPGTESDSDGPDPKLSAIAAKARDGSKKLNGGGTSDPATSKKRAADGKASEAQRSKKKLAQFERLFSEEDEIALLNGMIRFAEKNKSAPFADLDAFRDFVKADLNVDPTKDQLKHKMRKFKTKYDKNMRREASGGARSLKAHEQRAFELSKLAWANEYIKGQRMVAGKKRAKAKKAADVAANGGSAIKVSAVAEVVSMSDVSVDMTNISRIGAQLFEGGRGVEGEDQWLELKKAEMEVYLKKVELMCTKTRLVLDVLKANNC